MTTRTEKDSLGEMQVPAQAYYGAQTQRAIQNFPISGQPMPREFIHAHALLKKAAATVNRDLNLLKPELAAAIAKACDEVLADADWSKDQFPIDIYQTGSGTSTNMNLNEVLATRANKILGQSKTIHPNDHINLGQSSNDTIPTSLQVMALLLIRKRLHPALCTLHASLAKKSREFWSIIKTGRTHLQDATPIRLGQEFLGFAGQIEAAFHRFAFAENELRHLPIGGTAVGTGINAHPEYATRVCALLTKWLVEEAARAVDTFDAAPPVVIGPLHVFEASNHFWAQATLDTAVSAHSALKTLAVSLTKIANDIRWMGSGPRAGLGEIDLPAVQPGSSIMPGKVNPVIAESVLMACQRVIGNDAALTAAGTQNNFELAMSIPLAAQCLHESIVLMANSCTNFAKQCIDGLTATQKGPELVERGLMLATALAPVVGYDTAASIAKEAAKMGKTVREVAKVKTQLTEGQLKELLNAEKMVEPGQTSMASSG